MTARPPSNGFTLLETLVVLVIVSLVSTLLWEGLAFVLHLRSRLLVHLDQVQHGTLQESWFRWTTTALVSDYKGHQHLFQGNENEFSGLTMMPLDADEGEVLPFAWQLQHQTEFTTLRYRKSDGEYWEIARWPGATGSFRYGDAEGQWHKQWPPQFFKTTPPQLPALILLQGPSWVTVLTDNNETKFDDSFSNW